MREARRWLEVDGTWLHVRSAGDAGPAIVLLHQSGSGHSSRSWLPAMALLAPRYRLFAIDSPGFGDSPPLATPWTIEQYAAASATAARQLGLERYAIAGDHTGASVAIALAAGYLEAVTALVAVGVALWDEPTRAAMRQRAAEAPPPPGPAADGSHLTDLWQRIAAMNPDMPPETVHLVVVDALRAADPRSMHAPLHRFDVHAALARVRCPALIMAADDDVLAPFTEPAAALVAGSRTARADRGGSIPLLNSPAWVAAEIDAFLSPG